MSVPWSEIASYYRCELDWKPSDEGFQRAFRSIGDLAAKIDRTSVTNLLFGWTSVHDLCVQDSDRLPYSGAYLRISPLSSGSVGFRYIDAAMPAIQWRRVVEASDATQQFVKFVDQINWIDRQSASYLVQDS